MAEVYFIGGAPRVGKSTIMQKFIHQRPMHAVSTDAIREVLKGVLSEADNPDLFKSSVEPMNGARNISVMKREPESLVPHYIRHFDSVWKSVEDFIICNMNNGRDTVIEGTAILPRNIASLPYDHKAIFVTNLEDQTNVMLAHAQKHPHDWLSLYDEGTIRAFANFTKELNKYYYDEAIKNDLPVVMLKNNSFKNDIDKAVALLLA